MIFCSDIKTCWKGLNTKDNSCHLKDCCRRTSSRDQRGNIKTQHHPDFILSNHQSLLISILPPLKTLTLIRMANGSEIRRPICYNLPAITSIIVKSLLILCLRQLEPFLPTQIGLERRALAFWSILITQYPRGNVKWDFKVLTFKPELIQRDSVRD